MKRTVLAVVAIASIGCQETPAQKHERTPLAVTPELQVDEEQPAEKVVAQLNETTEDAQADEPSLQGSSDEAVKQIKKLCAPLF